MRHLSVFERQLRGYVYDSSSNLEFNRKICTRNKMFHLIWICARLKATLISSLIRSLSQFRTRGMWRALLPAYHVPIPLSLCLRIRYFCNYLNSYEGSSAAELHDFNYSRKSAGTRCLFYPSKGAEPLFTEGAKGCPEQARIQKGAGAWGDEPRKFLLTLERSRVDWGWSLRRKNACRLSIFPSNAFSANWHHYSIFIILCPWYARYYSSILWI